MPPRPRCSGSPTVGVDDDFFALGGDSISSIQLVIEARSAGLGLSTRQVFELRTCEALAVVAMEVARRCVRRPVTR